MISVYIKFIWMVVFTFLIFFVVRSVHSETMGDLIWKKGIYYKKNTNVPFSGKINGNIKGQIQNGKKEGTWVRYYSNGQLFSVSNYKTGRKKLWQLRIPLMLLLAFFVTKLMSFLRM